jgi:hypothetical protein
LLKVPGRAKTDVPILGSKPPTAAEVIILPQPLLKAMITVGRELKSVQAKWAVYGDAGQVALGVALKPDHLEILTTKAGTEEIASRLHQYQTLAPREAEKTLPREADIDGKKYPVYVKSHYAEFNIGGARLEVYGDLRMKVGEWEWGDPLDFEPSSISVVGTDVPLVPLRLSSELDLGLGWMDSVELISDAVMRSQHRH